MTAVIDGNKDDNNTELQLNLDRQDKIKAYELLNMIIRGDIAPKTAGYKSIEDAAIMIFTNTNKTITARAKAFEKAQK